MRAGVIAAGSGIAALSGSAKAVAVSATDALRTSRRDSLAARIALSSQFHSILSGADGTYYHPLLRGLIYSDHAALNCATMCWSPIGRDGGHIQGRKSQYIWPACVFWGKP